MNGNSCEQAIQADKGEQLHANHYHGTTTTTTTTTIGNTAAGVVFPEAETTEVLVVATSCRHGDDAGRDGNDDVDKGITTTTTDTTSSSTTTATTATSVSTATTTTTGISNTSNSSSKNGSSISNNNNTTTTTTAIAIPTSVSTTTTTSSSTSSSSNEDDNSNESIVTIVNSGDNNNENVNHPKELDDNQNMAYQQGYPQQQQQYQGYTQYPPAYSSAPPPAYGQQRQQQPQQVQVVYLPQPGYPSQQQRQGFNSGYSGGFPPNQQQGYNSGYPPQQQQGYNTGYPPQQGYAGPVYTVQNDYPQQNPPILQGNRVGGQTGSPVDYPRQAGFGDYINISTIAYISDFEDPAVRQAFIRKVYSIVTVQLMFCFGWVFACVYVEPINTYLREHPGILLLSYFLWMFMSVVTVCCCFQAFTTHPTDMILLFVQTVIMSVLAGCFAVLYAPKVVLLAFGTTIVLMILLTLFAFQTTIDLTQWMGVLAIAVIVVFAFAIFGIIVFPLVFGFYIPALHLVIGCLMVIFTCGFIVIDTQMLMRNKTYSLSPHMYAFGAYQIFSDVVILFLYLLQLFQACNDG